jgi:hypothetical protein
MTATQRLGSFLALAWLALPSATRGLAPARVQATAAEDPLAAELARWSAFLRDTTSADALWAQAKGGVQPVLERAQRALGDGRRLLALLRLEAARQNLAAAAYMLERPPEERASLPAFEAEWARVGRVLGAELGAPSADALRGVQPSALRALGEASLPQVRVYYEASVEYGRNTEPGSGLFYLGAAQAQRDFAAFCRRASVPSTLADVPLRLLGAELDALEAELLAAYRPPASIDKHREFIGVSAALKEARELDAAGLRHGALLRYLQAALRFGPLRAAPAPEAAALADRLQAFERRLSADGRDVSLGRLFLEIAQEDHAAAAGPGGATAAAVVSDVLPRYFAALEPAKPAPPRPDPLVTVTLVRWPYT